MSRGSLRYDVVVVGAGTTGAGAALQLAQRGMKVALVDAKPLERAGPSWTVLSPPRLFDQAGIDRPAGDELVSDHYRHLIEGPHPRFGRVVIDPCPAWAVDLPPLVRRLHAQAAAAGATLYGSARLTELRLSGHRPTGCTVHLQSPALRSSALHLRCDLLVDASGMAAAVRRRLPALHRHCPPPRPDELCHAAQFRFHVDDREAAASWLEATQQRAGDFLARNGTDGGFSTISVQIDPSLEHADVLTGTLASHPGSDAITMLERTLHELPWLGARGPGGSALIPVRRAYARLAVPGAALLGDAACQVFPSHGSGIGAGLVAGSLLASAVERAGEPGSPEVAALYQAGFHTGPGPTHAAHEAFRRSLETVSGDLGELMQLGLISMEHSRAAMDQTMPTFDLPSVVSTLRGAAHAPMLGLRAAPLPLRMLLAHRMGRRRSCTNLRRQQRWARGLAWAVGAPADPS